MLYNVVHNLHMFMQGFKHIYLALLVLILSS